MGIDNIKSMQQFKKTIVLRIIMGSYIPFFMKSGLLLMLPVCPYALKEDERGIIMMLEENMKEIAMIIVSVQ